MNNRFLISNTVLWLLINIFGSLHADENGDDIQRGLVYFSPPVFIAEKSQPCLGFRLSSNGILTSPACYIKLHSLMDQSVEALSEGGNVIGRVIRSTENRCDSETLSSYLFLERDSENISYKDFSFFTADVEFNNTELAVSYLIFDDSGTIAVKGTFDVNSNDEDESNAYLSADNNLPDGAVVDIKGKPLCIVSGNRCLRERAFKQINHSENYSACDQGLLSDMANISHFFDCRDSIITSDCYLFYGSLIAYGTCVNPCSHQRCPFYIEVVSDKYGYVNQYCGGIVYLNCADCLARFDYGGEEGYGDFPNCGLTEFPGSSKNCNPNSCIPGCESTSDKDSCDNGLRSVAPIAGGITAGVVLIGMVTTIATVIGCLIYKHKHRSGYQNL